ncbi:MAG TPA: DUF2589 domain-containing protein [Rhodocyclaceae bacterium]|nr:DUF2589 domain-containing protein [Rhodocyclaceae bacterium]
MADTPNVSTVGSEFQALPLDFIISAPLVAAVQAQGAIAATTKAFLQDVAGQTVNFKAQSDGNGGKVTREVNAPLLACVPVPHLRIDSLTTHFKFEINQVLKETDSTKGSCEGSLGGAGLAALLNLSIKGGLAHECSREATTNRSGMLEVTVHASESEMPAGLEKLLSWLTSGIQETAAPANPNPNEG